jgi:hypothetical protein
VLAPSSSSLVPTIFSLFPFGVQGTQTSWPLAPASHSPQFWANYKAVTANSSMVLARKGPAQRGHSGA